MIMNADEEGVSNSTFSALVPSFRTSAMGQSSMIVNNGTYSICNSENCPPDDSPESVPPKEDSVAPSSYLGKNLSPFWVVLTMLGIWFLFIITPLRLAERGDVGQNTPLILHLVSIYTLYLVCINNTLMTPSTTFDFGGKQSARPFHIYIGRAGMIGGIASTISGLYLTWFARASPISAISRTVAEMVLSTIQIVGYIAIKRYQTLKQEIAKIQNNEEEAEENATGNSRNDDATSTACGVGHLEQLEVKCIAALRVHIVCMIGIFVVPCSGAAFLRLIFELGIQLHALPLGITFVLVVWSSYSCLFLSRLDRKSSKNPEVEKV